MNWIFDIDGTLSDLSHRLHYIKDGKKDWKAFFANCGADAPIPEVIEIVRLVYPEHTVLLVTGRSDECQFETINWLVENLVPFHALYMRKAGDYREDSIVKSELLDKLRGEWGSDIAGVFEDRSQVVQMYRSKGLRVFQVAEGKF